MNVLLWCPSASMWPYRQPPSSVGVLLSALIESNAPNVTRRCPHAGQISVEVRRANMSKSFPEAADHTSNS